MLAFLQDIFGPSYRSTVIALATLLLGLVLFLLGWLTGEVSLKVLGLGMVPTAALGFVTRDNQASVQDHHESLQKIAAAENKADEKHVESAQGIQQIAVAVKDLAPHADLPIAPAVTVTDKRRTE